MKRTPSEFIGSLMAVFKHKLHTKRGHNVVLYIMCFIVASVFWFIIRLDDRYEREFNIPIEMTNVPDSVIIIDDVPKNLNVVLKGKGTQFVRYTVSNMPKFTIDFRQLRDGGRMAISRAKIESRLRDIFGQSVTVLVVNPDSMRIRYASGYGFKLPLKVNHKVSANSGSVISGEVTASVDSVTVYTISGKRPDVDFIETESVECVNLSDTSYRQVAVKQLEGMRVVPSKVGVVIPVEQLVSRKRMLQVGTENVPIGSRLIFHPTTIEVSYLVPMRLGNTEMPMKATVDYLDLDPATRNAKVNVAAMARDCNIVALSQDSVEYFIEH